MGSCLNVVILYLYIRILVFLRVLELEEIEALELAELALPAKPFPLLCASVYDSVK